MPSRTPTEEMPRIIEIDLRGGVNRLKTIALIVYISGLVVLTTISVWKGDETPLCAGFLVMGSLAIVVFLQRAVQFQALKRRILEIADEISGPVASEMLRGLLNLEQGLLVEALLREKAKQKRPPRVILVKHKADFSPEDPLVVPFEPRKFELAASLDNADAQEDSARQGEFTAAWSFLRCNWGSMASFAFMLGCFLLNLYRRPISGSAFGFNAATIFGSIAAWVLLAIIARRFGAMLGRRTTGQREWFVVPGGLVQKSCSAWDDQWDVRLFDRHDTDLLIADTPSGVFRIRLARDDESAGLGGKKENALFALRAWLSPLPPPSLEQLDDLR